MVRLTKTPVPDAIVTTMKYAESILLSSTTTAAYYFFGLNDVYDPNITGTGHQPLGHDQWAAFYDRNRVIGFDIHLKVLNESSLSALAGGIMKSVTSATTDIQTALEKEHSKVYLLSPLDVSNNAQREIVWTNQKPWTVIGVTRAEYLNSSIYHGTSGSSPSFRGPVLQLVSQCADKLTAVDVRFVVTISYVVELFERVSLTAS